MKVNKCKLTAEQIMMIANSMFECETYMAREICKWISIISYTTDIEIQKGEDGLLILSMEDYDKYYADGTIDMLENEIVNAYMVDAQYDSLVDIRKDATSIVVALKEKINQIDLKGFDVVKLLSDFRKEVGKINGTSKK